MRAGIIFLAILLLWPQTSFSAAGGQNAGLVAQIKNRYDLINSFDANFEQTLTHKESGASEKRTGRLLFQKPLLIRWQTSKPNEETLVASAKEIWDYLPEEKLAYRYPPAVIQDSRSIIQVLTGQAPLTRDFDIKSGGRENGLDRLTLLPKEPTTQMVEALIWVDRDGIIKRAKIIDFYGNGNDVRFTSFKPGASIPASQFRFTPPKGVEVEDRTSKEIHERELFR